MMIYKVVFNSAAEKILEDKDYLPTADTYFKNCSVRPPLLHHIKDQLDLYINNCK